MTKYQYKVRNMYQNKRTTNEWTDCTVEEKERLEKLNKSKPAYIFREKKAPKATKSMSKASKKKETASKTASKNTKDEK